MFSYRSEQISVKLVIAPATVVSVTIKLNGSREGIRHGVC